MNFLTRWLSPEARATLEVLYFGFRKIPMLYFVRPSVAAVSQEKVVVKIALRRRTRNHLGSMYFGALAVGADCAAGLIAMQLINRQPVPISLIFKDLKADFLQRAEGDVYFTCTQGTEIAALVARATQSDERVELPVHLTATVPEQSNDPVARFILTLSLKNKQP